MYSTLPFETLIMGKEPNPVNRWYPLSISIYKSAFNKLNMSLENSRALKSNLAYSLQYLKEKRYSQDEKISKACETISAYIEELHEKKLNVCSYKYTNDIVRCIREYLENEDKNIVFRSYILKDRIWANELESFLQLFQDYITHLRGINISFEQKRTDIGTIYVIQSTDSDLVKSEFNQYVSEFDFFLTNRDRNIGEARETLISLNCSEDAVDYGVINEQSMSNALQNLPDERYGLFSFCRPNSDTARALSAEVRRILYRKSRLYKVNTSKNVIFTLFWDENQNCDHQDLDLHLLYTDTLTGVSSTLSYKEQNIDGAQYSGDVRCSPGTEQIIIQHFMPGYYDLWVNNYSSEIGFHEGNPVVTVSIPGEKESIALELPNADDNSWWHVLRIDATKNVLKVINQAEGTNETIIS